MAKQFDYWAGWSGQPLVLLKIPGQLNSEWSRDGLVAYNGSYMYLSTGTCDINVNFAQAFGRYIRSANDAEISMFNDYLKCPDQFDLNRLKVLYESLLGLAEPARLHNG